MSEEFDRGQGYVPKDINDLERYLETHTGRGASAFPVFRGFVPYEMLREAGHLEIGSGIRVSHCIFGFDESYCVVDDFKLKGLLGDFAGKPGIHEPKNILKKEVWEFLK